MFISHAGPDKKAIVDLGLIQGLHTKGFKVCVDRPSELEGLPLEHRERVKGIRPGPAWRPSMYQMVEQADVVLACWSQEYLRRFDPPPGRAGEGQWLRDEITKANDDNKLAHTVLDDAKGFPAAVP